MTTSDEVAPEQESGVVTSEELQAKADAVQSLREQVADLENDRQQREAVLSNQIAMTQLETEEAQLRARLAQAQQAVEGGAVENAATPLATAREQMEAAVLSQQAAEAAANGVSEEPEQVSDRPGDDVPPPPQEPVSQDGSTPPAPVASGEASAPDAESHPAESPVAGAFTDPGRTSYVVGEGDQ